MDNKKNNNSAYINTANFTNAETSEFYKEFISDFPNFLVRLKQSDIGIVHLALSVSFFIFQLLIFTSFLNKKELFKKTCFHIIFHHGVLSCIQQICHIITAIFTILNIEDIDPLFAVIGALLYSTYIGSVLFILLLTLNRLDIMYNISKFHVKQKEKFDVIGIIILYCCTVGLFVFYITPRFNVTFDYLTFQWEYVHSLGLDIGFEVKNKTVFISLGISFVLQMCIIGKVFSLRCYTQKKAIFVAEDIKIVIHVFLCFVTTLFLELIWDGMFFELATDGIGVIVPQILYIFSSVSNSIFVLFFVEEIRDNVIFFKYCKKNKKIKSKISVLKTRRITTEKNI
uniref:7TM_GPCR_Srx domain-containing protein n=1 Tax=Strongyloides papillosus TaxID=174720 RepID=A0A0N5BKN4_STREA